MNHTEILKLLGKIMLVPFAVAVFPLGFFILGYYTGKRMFSVKGTEKSGIPLKSASAVDSNIVQSI